MPGTRYFGQSTAKPQASIANVENWWMPTLGDVAVGGYAACKVRVVSTADLENFTLTFDLFELDTSREPRKGLEVDLTNLRHVWPGIPSTAVHATAQEFGYLLLSEAYLLSKGIENTAAFADGGGKWPWGADGELASTGEKRPVPAPGLAPAHVTGR